MKKGNLLWVCVLCRQLGGLGLENMQKSIFGIFHRSRYRQICWVNSFHLLMVVMWRGIFIGMCFVLQELYRILEIRQRHFIWLLGRWEKETWGRIVRSSSCMLVLDDGRWWAVHWQLNNTSTDAFLTELLVTLAVHVATVIITIGWANNWLDIFQVGVRYILYS